MADQGAYQHTAHDTKSVSEDERHSNGLFVVSSGVKAVSMGGMRNPVSNPNACHTCKQPGHLAKDCPRKIDMQECKECKQLGHTKLYCPEITCSNCLQQGHMRNACEAAPACKVCYQAGHMARHCPARPPKVKPCKKCGSVEHPTNECKNPKCANCGSAAHALADCFEGKKLQSGGPSTTTAAAPSSTTAVPGGWDNDASSSTGYGFGGSDTDPTPPAAGFGGWDTVADTIMADTSSAAADKQADGTASSTTPAGPVPTEEEEAAAVEADPLGTLPKDDMSQTLSARIHLVLSPQHASHIRVQLDGSYNSDNISTGRDHKTAALSFYHEHHGSDARIREISPDSPGFVRHASPAQVDEAKAMLGSDVSKSLKLFHLHFSLPAVEQGTRPLVGQAFYSDVDVGPFTAQFAEARAILTGTEEVSIDFFTVNADFVRTRFEEIMPSMEEQALEDPQRKWWPHGVVNPQAGMQLPQEDQPKDFKIAKSLIYRDKMEYFTKTFQLLAHESEYAVAGSFHLTTMRIAKFSGGQDQLYYAQFVVPEGTSFRAGARLDVRIKGPEGSDATDWSATLVEALPFAKCNEHSCFLYRPRNGPSFVRDPEFEEGTHVVHAGNATDFGAMGDALQSLPGVRVWVRPHVPKVGIKRAINTVNHLYLGGDAFAQELQLLLTNNLLGLPGTSFFQHLIDAYGEANVMEEVDLMRAQLSEEQKGIIDSARSMKGSLLLVQGIGGTGKSKVLVEFLVFKYRLEAKYGDGDWDTRRVSGSWVVSPINQQLDDLITSTVQRCTEEYQKLLAENLNPRPLSLMGCGIRVRTDLIPQETLSLMGDGTNEGQKRAQG
ncbi:hypothetical protein HBI81_256390 [Parastagonospora nodorum]|nr:hypothetical protein HBI18_241130 [Parastagonospora nodorum]KAH6510772.1 hypothetical protein HBI81_256390 [Parastagonospora nodorum]